MRVALAVFCATTLASPALAQTATPAAGWRGDRRLAVVYEASVGSPTGFIRFRCTIIAAARGFSSPQTELMIEATFWSGPLRSAKEPLTASAGERILTLQPDPSAAAFDVASFTWRGTGPEQIDETGLRFVGDADRSVVFRSPSGAEEAISVPMAGDTAPLGEIRRCSTASILGVQRAAALSANQLLPMWGQAEDGCRGGHPPENAPSCDQRAAFHERLTQLGWCYGRPGEAGYQMRWRRCRG